MSLFALFSFSGCNRTQREECLTICKQPKEGNGINFVSLHMLLTQLYYQRWKLNFHYYVGLLAGLIT